MATAGLHTIEELGKALEASMEAVRFAQESGEKGVIDRARVLYDQTRRAFITVLIEQEIDDTKEPLASLVAKDLKFFTDLRKADEAMLQNVKDMEVAQRPPREERTRLIARPRTIKVPKNIDLVAARNFTGKIIQMWNGSNCGTEKIQQKKEYLDDMAVIIGFTVAEQLEPKALGQLEEIAQQSIAAERLSTIGITPAERDIAIIKICRKMLKEFGQELCELAEDRDPGNIERWVHLADRMIQGFDVLDSRMSVD